jgi:O-antigen/teichoic acid export membrane protein
MTDIATPPPSGTEPDADPDSLSRADIKEAMLKGVKWITLGRIVSEVIAFAASVVLARMVSPAEFGHAVLAIFLMALAGGLPSGSFGSPLVQASELRRAAVATALTLSLVCGIAISAIIVVAAPALSGIFDHRTIELLQLCAPVFAIYCASSVSQALLQRKLDFRRMALLDIVTVVPATAVSVAGAALGWGGAAIVAGFLATALGIMILALFWAPPGRPGYDGGEARHILKFGVPFSMSSLLWNASRNIQLAILGSKMPAAEVGAFWRASMLGIFYQGKVSTILLRMLFPVLSRARSAADVQAFRTRMVQVHTTLLFPCLALLAILAPVLIPFLYGPDWDLAIVPTQILAIAGAATVVGTGTGPLMMAIGRPDALMRYDFVYLVVFAGAMLLAVSHGLTVVAIVVAVHALVFLIVQQYFLAQRLAGIPLKATLTEAIAAAVGCMGLAAVALPVDLGLRAIDTPSIIVLCATGAVGMTAYALTIRQFYAAIWSDLVTIFSRFAPSGRPRLARRRARSDP